VNVNLNASNQFCSYLQDLLDDVHCIALLANTKSEATFVARKRHGQRWGNALV